MPRLPDFEGLATVAKIAEQGSYAGAARSLGLSAATVSRAVTRLEERLGGRIFNRTSRRLALTDFGAALVERATRVLNEAEEAENVARNLTIRPRGAIRLATPISFGLRWVAPLLPEFLRLYPEVSVDLHLSDAPTDLIGGGFDAALRIAVLEESSLVVRRLCPVERVIVASPAYLKRYGRPQHPRELSAHRCLGYAFRARGDAWRLTGPNGEEVAITPSGPLRATNVDALVPTLLDGQGITELPDFVAAEYLADRRIEAVLPTWRFRTGGLYFVTPTARMRLAKVEALASFLVARLSRPGWAAADFSLSAET